jgi:hypothetical protein
LTVFPSWAISILLSWFRYISMPWSILPSVVIAPCAPLYARKGRSFLFANFT